MSGAARWAFGNLVKPAHLAAREAGSRAIDRALGITSTDEVVARALGVDIGHFRRTQRALGYTGTMRLVRRLRLGPGDVFLDVGCGAGRATCLVALTPARRAIGIDLDPRMADLAGRNAARLRMRRCPIEIEQADATAWETPDDVTCVYMYNPVQGPLLEAVLRRLLESVDRRPRPVRLAYANPVDHELVMRLGRFRPAGRMATGWRPGRDWGRTQTVQFYEVTPPDAAG
jgi:SAM-dependent methyltransferase